MPTKKPKVKSPPLSLTRPPFASRGAIIKTQRIKLGWSIKECETHTKLSAKTLRKAEKGVEDIGDEPLAAIAVALGLNFETLKYDLAASRGSISSKRNEDPKVVRIRTGVEYEVLIPDPSVSVNYSPALAEFVASLAKTIDAANRLLTFFVTRGSAIVHLIIYVDDIHRLALAFVEGRLEHLKIDQIDLRGDTTSAYLRLKESNDWKIGFQAG